MNHHKKYLEILENTLESNATIAKIKKIHRQFGHASVENMKKDASMVLMSCSCGMFARRKALNLLSTPTAHCRKFSLS